MKRGDVVKTIGRGDFSTRPRPSLVVQADWFNEYHPSITVCPITSHVTGDSLYRVAIWPSETTGLDRASEVEIDRVQAIWRDRVGGIIGCAPDEVMLEVDRVLREWLAL